MEVREPSARYLKTPVKLTEIGAIPLDWEVKQIGELCSIRAGGDVDRGLLSSHEGPSHPYPIWANAKSSAPYGYSSMYQCPAESLTVTARGDIGHAVYRDRPYCAVGRLLSLIPTSRVSARFISEFINARVTFASESTGVPQLTGPQIANYSIAIPCAAEETHLIAEALSAADALIDSLEQLLTKKRQIKQGAMQELLTGKRRLPGYETPWIRRPFAEVASVSRERVNPSALNTPPLCVELEHLQPGTGRLVEDAFESQQAAIKSVFRQGDVLFGKLRAYLRKYWMAEFDGVCSTEIWVLRPRGELASNAYLFYTIQRDDFIDAASNAYGTHMPRSDWKIVSEFSLSLPGDGMEQAAIAQVLSDMDTEIAVLESRLSKARALKQAMAQALLTGRIRLVEPTA